MWEGDSEALLQAVRFLGCGGAIAVLDVGGAIAFEMWECDRFFGNVGGRSLFEDVGGRSLLEDVGDAIAFGVWEGDSEALLQAVRFLGM
ncbi:MAG: hypothetical protein NTY89_18560 [Nostocales cyanobacterium LacPavin_0920_SED1_MAG_38_18]|nr:hypothetical protein [Nostocales cyanobacterium LacPavin_0920_SED1_MAG_38_18]